MNFIGTTESSKDEAYSVSKRDAGMPFSLFFFYSVKISKQNLTFILVLLGFLHKIQV